MTKQCNEAGDTEKEQLSHSVASNILGQVPGT